MIHYNKNNNKKLKKKPKRSLGQHFLVDKEIIKKIIEISNINDNNVTYEVGTGDGVLTNELCKLSKFVYSFEIDPYYYSYCKKKLDYKNLKLFNKDGFNNEVFHFDIFFLVCLIMKADVLYCGYVKKILKEVFFYYNANSLKSFWRLLVIKTIELFL